MCNRVKQVSWQDVRDEVIRADANLAATFSESHVFKSPARGSFEPGAFLYRAEYEYGSLIVNQGKFVPPSCDLGEGCVTCRNLKAATLNSPIPLAVILENSVEVFVDTWSKEDPRHTPLRLIPAGEMFGTFAGSPSGHPISTTSLVCFRRRPFGVGFITARQRQIGGRDRLGRRRALERSIVRADVI